MTGKLCRYATMRTFLIQFSSLLPHQSLNYQYTIAKQECHRLKSLPKHMLQSQAITSGLKSFDKLYIKGVYYTVRETITTKTLTKSKK